MVRQDLYRQYHPLGRLDPEDRWRRLIRLGLVDRWLQQGRRDLYLQYHLLGRLDLEDRWLLQGRLRRLIQLDLADLLLRLIRLGLAGQ